MDVANQERLYHWLARLSRRVPFDIKTTAAQPYRRVLLQEYAADRAARPQSEPRKGQFSGIRSVFGGSGRAPRGVNGGNGFLFISHICDVYPSGFLPVKVGSVREASLRQIYRDSPVLQALRDPNLYKGKCGVCE
ncbi:MAG: radical SAM/SPASM domain-containing protein, partial [Alicyclobacillaceae bacterium]|nr:radical SAM/SPASM domain-containing protein [Alicyclobacillaceae bacterium]